MSAVWNFCCSERTKRESLQGSGSKGSKGSRTQPFGQFRLREAFKPSDGDLFDDAVAAQDLHALVRLLQSQERIEEPPVHRHPWAEDPRTVGALAATQLAILASTTDEIEGRRVKQELLQAGAISPLVEFLRSDQIDRVQTAVVALKFMLDECFEGAVMAYECGAMPLLLQQLESSSEATPYGMKAAAATALRNLVLPRMEYRSEFSKLGGIRGFVHHLASEPDPALKHADVQLEAIFNLQDVMEDLAGTAIEWFAFQALDAGAEKTLNEMLRSPDSEVQSQAAEVLEKLAPVIEKWKVLQ